MLDTGKINPRQFTIVVTLFMVGSAILIFPSILASSAKQDSWIAAIAAVCAGLLILPLYASLGKRFPGLGLGEYSQIILGRWLGKAAFLLFLTYPLLSLILTLRNIGDFMTTQIIRETPMHAINIFFIAVVVMGVKLGLEPLARAAELFFPSIILLFIILMLLVSPQMKLANMQPVLENGWMPVLKGAIPFFSFPFLSPVVFLMVFPSVNRAEKAGKALFKGVLLGGILLTAIAVMTTSVMGSDQVARSSFPSYDLAMRINIGDFLERIEIIMAIIWFITIFFRMSLLHHIVALGIAQTLRLRDHRILAIPLAVVAVPLAAVFVPTSTYLSNFNRTILPLYVPTLSLLFPLLLLTVAVIRNIGGRQDALGK